MTVYTTIDDIAAFYVGTGFSISSSPSTSQIERWIVESSSWLNLHLSKKFTLPITNHGDLMVLQSIANEYVIARVEWMQSRNRANVTKKINYPTKPDDTCFFEKMKLLAAGEYPLNSLIGSTSSYSYNADNAIVAHATKETSQW